MQRFDAHAYFAIGNGLGFLQNSYKRSAADVSLDVSEAIFKALQVICDRCKQSGLAVSGQFVEELIADVKRTPRSKNEFGDTLSHLADTIRIEMSQSLFMYIPQARAAFFDKAELFGKAVNAAFPTIQFDMVEAGNCYAAGRGTATVFHLMRIMEVGVQQFGNKLGVTFVDAKNWHNILEEVDKAIKNIPKTDRKRVEMCQTSANLYAVKLAWRNEVMHPKETYTLEEADNLIRQVKIFMEQLAIII